MSNEIAIFHSDVKDGFPKESRKLYVTAFVGDGHAIQLTTDTDYFTLTEKQVRNLIKVFQARLDGVVTATGTEDLGDFFP